MTETPEQLARAVAVELGPEAAADAQAELQREKTRSLGQHIIDAATIGAFVAQTAQLAIQLRVLRRTHPELIAELEAKTASAVAIAAEKRRSVIARIADVLFGGAE